MICTSIQNKTFEEILQLLDDPFVQMAEIRLDRCSLTDEQITDLFETVEKPLVATCHETSDSRRRHLLEVAAQAGAFFIDADVDLPAAESKFVQTLCQQNGTALIRSYHNTENTPDLQMLQQIVSRARRYGADIVKIVTRPLSPEDVQTVLSLYESDQVEQNSLVAFCLDEMGTESRVECLKKGAPFSYACVSEQQKTAPGQIPYEKMHSLVYGERGGYFGTNLKMPCSKSFAQRAILAAALAEGESHLSDYTPCDDSEAALGLALQMGAKVVRRGTNLLIRGIGASPQSLSLDEISTAESGLLTRLCIPVFATLNKKDFHITGKGTLPSRPLSGASDIMASFGVMLSNAQEHSGKDIYVPLDVHGNLMGGSAVVPGSGGSQLISGLLTALPLCEQSSRLHITDPKSIPYMFITLDVLRHFGIKVRADMEGDASLLEEHDWSGCDAVTFYIEGGQHFRSADFSLEADWSAAASFLVGGAIFGSADVLGVDVNSIQADITIMDILAQAGAALSYDEQERVVSCHAAPLRAFEFDLNNCPDLFPIVSVLAAFCPGVSTLSGVGRLKRKESDRGRSILQMLTRMGVKAQIVSDQMQIEGMSYARRCLTGNLLQGGEYTSSHDHRMAMALSIASYGAADTLSIDDKLCVSKSFPEFFDTL